MNTVSHFSERDGGAAEEKVDYGQAYMMGHTRQYVKAAIPFEEGLKNTTVKGRLTEKLSDEILLLK